ncbi:DNA replication and repair protein RecO [Crinalium epipsammum PCC 9333]|uniref:DNA repair protein RecO n=1 Tax=Crinalium epipsammum PCC 9333 TaxID=1173022 RepID=K9W038_9CYAN|nr:DNA repair protein RecO [Crinalium epipsammum]AFZ13149.1 DNA replication and repair protein RecO [Crinalium epipsammum PCC 9333]
MSRTYKVTGINLKGMPLGEADRLLTILTQELGLIRVVAPGARKQNSKLGGRSGLFVVNELLIAKGRSLDKITQAETVESYPGLSKDLGKLAASQYLAEIVVSQALSEQPQAELYAVLNEHLRRIEQFPSKTSVSLLPYLCHGVFHLLALAGIAPQVHACCLTKDPLTPNFTDPNWRVGFSLDVGGTISLLALNSQSNSTNTTISDRSVSDKTRNSIPAQPKLHSKLNALELTLFQQLATPDLNYLETFLPTQEFTSSHSPTVDTAWESVERILRQYTQYHLGHPIRSATLMDACFSG